MIFSDTTEALLSSIKSSPILATGLGLWGAAMLTFITKDIPNKIWNSFKREFTTSIIVGIRERELVALTQWASKYKLASRPRTFHLKDQILTAADGIHFFCYKQRLCWFERLEIKSKDVIVNVGEQKNPTQLKFGYFGRNKDFLIDLFRLSTAWDPTQAGETHIFTPRWRDWHHVASQAKRNLNQLILPNNIVTEIRSHLDWFYKSPDWFHKMGVPYRTGICLYGPPGTGKTSVVRAIAAEWNLSIYSVDFSNMDDSELKDIIWKIGPQALVLIEDIDTLPGAMQREDAVHSMEDTVTKFRKTNVTLGGLLNAIDGVVDSDGRVFVMTTNHIEKLDPALLRPGRVNLKLKLDYMTPEMFSQGFTKFFPNIKLSESVNWKADISPAYFQSLIFKHLNSPDEVLKSVTQDSKDILNTVEQLETASNVYNIKKFKRGECKRV